jgi:hypothetical protein
MIRELPPRIKELMPEARRICDREGITSEDDFRNVLCSLTRNAYLSEIEPIMRIKTRFFSCRLPTMTMHSDGKIEIRYDLTDVEKKTLAGIEEMITDISRKYTLSP